MKKLTSSTVCSLL